MVRREREVVKLWHEAFFWLKNAGTQTDREALIAALKTRRAIDLIWEPPWRASMLTVKESMTALYEVHGGLTILDENEKPIAVDNYLTLLGYCAEWYRDNGFGRLAIRISAFKAATQFWRLAKSTDLFFCWFFEDHAAEKACSNCACQLCDDEHRHIGGRDTRKAVGQTPRNGDRRVGKAGR